MLLNLKTETNMATFIGNLDTHLPRQQPQHLNRYRRRRRKSKHLGGSQPLLFKFILVVGSICHAGKYLVVENKVEDVSIDSPVGILAFTTVEAVETVVAPTENYHGGDNGGHVNTYDADTHHHHNNNNIGSNYDNNGSDDQPLDQTEQGEEDKIPDFEDVRNRQNEEEGEDQVHRNVPLDVIDDRTWLDIYADQTKTLLIDGVTKYWNQLRRQHGDYNYDVGSNAEIDGHHHHQWHRLRRKIQHFDLTKITSSINNDRVHSFAKKVSIRTAMTISSSFERLTEWSRPFRNKVRYQSQSIKHKTSQRTQHIVSGIEDRFQFIAEKLGHDICNDLRQRCQEEQQQRQLYSQSSSSSSPTRTTTPANQSSEYDEDPAMTTMMTTKPILQLAWQERLLCYRSVVVEDCLQPEV